MLQLQTSSSKLVSVKSFEDEPNISFSAYDLMHYDANKATPVITLTSVLDSDKKTWTAEQDLLADGPTDTHFVVEIESDGTARLRFGDNTNGLRPDSDTGFTASYRIGNGTAGNVGADTLINCSDLNVTSCTNPLPAVGGTDPETTDQIRRRAPQAFMTQDRAIIMPDYVRVTEMNSQVENAVATLRWTGSWYTVFITAEPKGAGNLTPTLRRELKKNINRYRLAGEDIELEPPQYVSLEITLTICVDPDYFQSDVEKALTRCPWQPHLVRRNQGTVLSRQFHLRPDRLSEPHLCGRTQGRGRAERRCHHLPAARSDRQPRFIVTNGEIPLGPFQIARLDNDPSLPDHGQLTLVMEGGK